MKLVPTWMVLCGVSLMLWTGDPPGWSAAGKQFRSELITELKNAKAIELVAYPLKPDPDLPSRETTSDVLRVALTADARARLIRKLGSMPPELSPSGMACVPGYHHVMKWISARGRENQLKISFVCEFVDWSGHGGLAPKAIHEVLREEFRRAGIPSDPKLVTSTLAARPRKPVVRPPLMRRIAGLTEGEDELRTIRERFGHGHLVEDEGHTGGLYYLSPDRRLMLHVELGEGYRIERLELLSAELFPADLALSDPEMISPALAGPLNNEFGLQLGMTPEQVKNRFKNLSPGHDDQGRETLSFSVDGESDDQVAYYELTFVFVEKRLAGIQLYDGE